MCCWIYEVTFCILGLTFGTVGLIRGKVPITPRRYVTTLPACLAAVLLILPFPLFAVTQGTHLLAQMNKGEEITLGELPFLINVGLTPVCAVVALLIVVGSWKRFRTKTEAIPENDTKGK